MEKECSNPIGKRTINDNYYTEQIMNVLSHILKKQKHLKIMMHNIIHLEIMKIGRLRGLIDD